MGGGSSVSPGVLDRPGTTPEDTEGPYIENAKKTGNILHLINTVTENLRNYRDSCTTF